MYILSIRIFTYSSFHWCTLTMFNLLLIFRSDDSEYLPDMTNFSIILLAWVDENCQCIWTEYLEPGQLFNYTPSKILPGHDQLSIFFLCLGGSHLAPWLCPVAWFIDYLLWPILYCNTQGHTVQRFAWGHCCDDSILEYTVDTLQLYRDICLSELIILKDFDHYCLKLTV